jgi:hypothetical protein
MLIESFSGIFGAKYGSTQFFRHTCVDLTAFGAQMTVADALNFVILQRNQNTVRINTGLNFQKQLTLNSLPCRQPI